MIKSGLLTNFSYALQYFTNGNVYVAEESNEDIRKITPAGAVTTFVGLAGSYGTADGTGNSARFNFPTALAIDASGNIYVADTQNATIRKVTPNEVVTTVAGFPGSGGAADGTGNATRFNTPTGIAIDTTDNIYVVDNGNNVIRKAAPFLVVNRRATMQEHLAQSFTVLLLVGLEDTSKKLLGGGA